MKIVVAHAEQVGEETRCERREYADVHNAGFASSECPRVDRRMTYLSDGFARVRGRGTSGLHRGIG